jgi:BirA family transcriptional regulator, biotin operon repressor / biotin---[acetyl-CoA-carboxylase] ligase
MNAAAPLAVYDFIACDELAKRCGVPRVMAVESCESTMDLAHALAAEGAPHGSVVVADQQNAGRGRAGKSWTSASGAGVWASVILRQRRDAQGGVLSLRTGIRLAPALDRYVNTSVQLKWPNDLYADGKKLAGVLTEARWRGDALEWIVVGVGVNLRHARGVEPLAIATLGTDASRADVLVDVVRAVVGAADGGGELSASEMAAFTARDVAIGREIVAPLVGTVLGITSDGGLRVRTAAGDCVAIAGSLMLRTPLAE